MRNQEEIELAINNHRLFNETIINISSLWRIVNVSVLLSDLEESLSNSLVDNNEGVLWSVVIAIIVNTVFHVNNLVELLKFVSDYLSSHRISDSISVDKDMVWKCAIVMISVSLESFLEVTLEDA